MNFGISTACLYPAETETALLEIARMGVAHTEIFFNASRELSGPVFDRIREIQRQWGLRVAAVHPFTTGLEPFLLFSDYYRRFEDTLEHYKQYAEAAAALSAPYILIHGDIQKGRLSEAEYFERFARLREICIRHGAEPVQENVNLFRSASPDFVRRMKAALPDQVKFALDIKQCIRSEVNPFEMLSAMGQQLAHVHLSDHSPTQSCLLPGRGIFDFRKLFAALRGAGYEGSLLIEVYRGQFSEPRELRSALRTLTLMEF